MPQSKRDGRACRSVFLLYVFLASRQVQTLVLRDLRQDFSSASVLKNNVESCSKLTSHGTHYTVQIDVGTPPQTFDVVADTGSNAVIVQSCLCREITEECKETEKCFIGTNKSSTFIGPRSNASLVKLQFGSGNITGAIATDIVSVGSVSATMTSGLLLMVKRELSMTQNFEGILGLGVPTRVAKEDAQEKPKNTTMRIPQFLDVASIAMFSICFKFDQEGTLRLNPPEMVGMLKQVGRKHWSLSLEGFSVGGSSMPVSACNPESKPSDLISPCAAIPDSGTTHILGPKEDIDHIFADICDRWPRCETYKSENSVSSQMAFEHVLYGCQDWVTEEHGLAEIPSLFLHMKAADGKTQTLELTAMSFVYGVMTEEGNTACFPSFGEFRFPTKRHGPAWILGTPLFYEYQVGFGLQSLSLGFSKQPCQLCGDEVAPSFANTTGARSMKRPRIVSGRPRLPNIDVTDEL